MLTTMRMARMWTLWLAVLAFGAIVPGLGPRRRPGSHAAGLGFHQGRQPT